MSKRYDLPNEALTRLRFPLNLTRVGMVAERLTRAFWPFWSILFVALAALAFNAHEVLPLELVWTGAVLALGFGGWAFVHGILRFQWPSQDEALERLDGTMPGRPIAALSDTQAIGAGDMASEAVWKAHVARMAERAAQAEAVEPDLNLASRDPFALRYVALTALVMALFFGSFWRVSTVSETVAIGPGAALASGPAWEGWIEPPPYTGMPSLYLNDISDETFAVPENSRVTLRLYGEVGALTVDETVSGRTADPESTAEPVQEFQVAQSGELEISGSGGQTWSITVTDDLPPSVVPSGEIERTLRGEMKQPFSAADDYGVVAGRAEIILNEDALDRRYGLVVDPEPREMLTLDLPMTITGDRSAFEEVLIEDLSKHPWANLPVKMTLIVADAAGQSGQADPIEIDLPGRRFFDPVANAVIEMRRDLLWSRDNLRRTVQILRTVTYKPDDLRLDSGVYLQLRTVMRRLEATMNSGGLTVEARDEVAEILWEIALKIEEGDLSDALEQLRKAQDRLSEAMKNGASQEEIDQLMKELADAMQNYMRQLAQEDSGEGEQSAEAGDPITGDQLRQMLEDIQRLMEEGRMAEAQALLQQLMEMMENMRVTQGEGGEPSPGQQAMEDLAETLRDQQELSDESFRDLQNQYNPGGQNSNQPQQGQQSQSEGEGESQEGQGQQQGMGQSGDGDRRSGQGNGGSADPGSLADRQEALRRELERQENNLPGAGSEEGDAARDALDRAGNAMDQAEEALRNNDLSRAIDRQAEAMDALRDGMRKLGDALADNQQEENPGEQGQTLRDGQRSNDPRDPLGREPGATGQRIGTDENLIQGDDVYRRAQEILDEIRRRSGDQERPEVEREYLERLLEQF